MNIDNIRKLIEKHVHDNWTKTSVAWFNVPFRAEDEASFIEVHILPGEGQEISLGPKTLNRWSGIAQINVNIPRGQGTRMAYEYAGELIDLFFGFDLQGLTCRTGYISNLGNQGNYFVLAVTIPFIYDEFLEVKK